LGKPEKADSLAGGKVNQIPSELRVDGKSLEVFSWQPSSAAGSIVLIHEALGSVSYWKDFPEMLAAATGCTVVAYSRAGHGNSEGPVEPRTLDYYRRQVDTVLPAILNHFNISNPVLYGHSEGAAIAMLYAATGATTASHKVRAIIAEAPIVASEEQTGHTIRQIEANYITSDMSQRLARYHANPDEVFYSWIQSNRRSFVKEFPLEEYLKRIECPLLVLQGSHDEFGGILQYQTIHRCVPHAQHEVFEAGHLLHREQPDLVPSAVSTFLNSLPASTMASQQPNQKSSQE
jgi:pimeloyl-ACP methyl ester carboxylesterase